MELKFRNLYADEIELRVSNLNKGGVTLLAYKDARCDQRILDELVGPYNWQRHHSRDNANCIVSIYDPDKKQWIEKEDTGKESFSEKEKGLASDSFKRACFNWGIGRALYTCPTIYIPRDRIEIVEKNDKEYVVSNFVCSAITYSEDEKKIESITVDIYKYSTKTGSLTFKNNSNSSAIVSQTSQTKVSQPVTNSTENKPANTNAQTSEQSKSSNNSLLKDDEIILMGNCRNKKYGEVKNTDQFKSFLGWAKNSDTKYPNPEIADQFARIKKLAESVA